MPEIQVSVAQQQDTTSSAGRIRQHQVLIDRPEAKGGGDAGPMGGELLLASLGGCFMSNLIAAARARETAVRNLLVEVTGVLEGTPPRFQNIRMTVSGAGVARDQLEKLVTIAERGCIVANTLKGAVELEVTAA